MPASRAVRVALIACLATAGFVGAWAAEPPPATPAPAATAPAKGATPDYAAIVAAPDRTDADRALDAGRHPAELLAFAQIKVGDHVAELGAGGGYTTELLARAVGPTGQVYGQNSKDILEKFAAGPWAERLARPACANVTALEAPFDAPFPASVHDLDAVLIVLIYHDTVWMGVDRDKMNAAVFKALKPGGAYVVVDHAAADFAGVAEVKTLHRIEEATVKSEVLEAGFALDTSGEFLRNKGDAHDWNASPGAAGELRGKSDRFALRFRKPG
jgi:predicted methyltransferase